MFLELKIKKIKNRDKNNIEMYEYLSSWKEHLQNLIYIFGFDILKLSLFWTLKKWIGTVLVLDLLLFGYF